jgi:hypothetical protein
MAHRLHDVRSAKHSSETLSWAPRTDGRALAFRAAAVPRIQKEEAMIRHRPSLASFALRALSVTGVSFLLAACSASGGSPPEETGTTEQALGEAVCATNPLGGPDAGGVFVSPGGQGSMAGGCSASSTITGIWPYGSPGCADQYIFNVFGNAGGHVAAVSPATLPTQETTCQNTTVTLALYGHNASGWTLVGTTTQNGQWWSGGAFGSSCVFDTGTGSKNEIQIPYGFDEIRAVGSAWLVLQFKGHWTTHYENVTISVLPNPC